MTSESETVGRRPNVLVIITDQHRADHVGFAGNDVVRTPNLDALADRGTVFEKAWVSNPVCMPNRSTIMTGRMPSAHGSIFNDRSLEWGANTHVRSFREAGWRTALIGKSHLQHGMSRNTVHGVESGAVETAWPEGWDTLEHEERYQDGPPEFPDSFYGFGHVELAIDHGAKLSGHHLLWAVDKGARYEDLAVDYDAGSPAQWRSDYWWQVYQPPYGPEVHSTTFVTERTIDFITDAAGRDEPWLAWASFPDPHHPLTPPGEWLDRHKGDDMPLPLSIEDPMVHGPKYLKRLQQLGPDDQRNWVTPFGAGNHHLVRECIAATYGMVEMIDDGVGKILATLDRLGIADDTIVVFTSDHGDMMGDHGLMLKGFMHYRGTLQVPMVIAHPDRVGGRTESLASSIDLGPTLLELCGVTGYDGIQGTSLVPILDDPMASVRESVLVEDDLPQALAGLFPHKTRTVVTQNFKYTRHSTGEEQLFDLVVDPDELDEVAHRDPRRRLVALEALTDAMIGADDTARGTPLVAP